MYIIGFHYKLLRVADLGGCKKLKNLGSAFFEQANTIKDSALSGVANEPLWGLVERFVAEAEGSEMHWDKSFCPELEEGFDGLLWVHVDIPLGRGVVGTDWQECNFHGQALADLAESLKIGAVATVENRAPGIFDVESPEAAVRIVQNPRAPMPSRCECDLERAKFKGLPVLQLLHMLEAESMNEAAYILWDDDSLVAGHSAKRLAVQMVEMGVRHQHKVDSGQVVDFQARLLDALNHFQPLRPIRINEHAMLGSLNEERGVADPCDTNLAMLEFRENWLHSLALAFGKKRWNHDFCEEISLMPSAAEFHVHMVLGLSSCGDFSLDELPDHAYVQSP